MKRSTHERGSSTLPDARRAVKHGPRGRRGRPSYVACGFHAARAFLEARPADVESVLAVGEARRAIEPRAAAVGVTVEPADHRTLAALAGGVPHQGVVAVGRPPPPWSLEDLLARAPDALVVLDGLTDPRNVGAVLRSAEAMGMGGVVVARDRAPGLTPALVKAAAGAVEWVPMARVVNVARALARLRSSGYWVLGLEAAAAADLGAAGTIPALPAALVLGAEGAGLRPLVRRGCDRLVRIPMAGRADSLNVAVAAGIGFWEISRLRGRTSP